MKDDLLDLMLKRRSIRKYTNIPIPENIINNIMNKALTAPCSFGHRPCEFVVVKNKDLIKKLAECKSLGGSQIIGADTVIVVIVNLKQGEFWIEDGAIASTYILLAAEQYDIGACWVQIRNRNGKKKTSSEEIRELLNIPNGYEVLNLIALGNKGENKREYELNDYDKNKIHYESY